MAPFKSSRGKDSIVSKLLKISAASQLGKGLGSGGDIFVPFKATGGQISTIGEYTIHTFAIANATTGNPGTSLNSSMTIQGPDSATQPLQSADVLIVAGGGAGGVGAHNGGGGGAGGYTYLPSISILPLRDENGVISVVVGRGGDSPVSPGGSPSPGENSSFGTWESYGGGIGGSGCSKGNTGNGGSAGGTGTGPQPGASNNSGIGGGPGGNRPEARANGSGGGRCEGVSNTGGGGGGAGSGGGNGNNYPGPGQGGAGSGLSNDITGSSVTYAQGGNSGGGTWSSNTGSGGHGRGSGAPDVSGAPGIVVVKYVTPST